MPELPEVQTVVNSLRTHVLGRRFGEVTLFRRDILWPDGCPLESHLSGHLVQSLDRRGKRILFTLDDGNRFYIHLGMSGQLSIADGNTPRETHTHLEVQLHHAGGGDTGRVMRFRDPRRFGGVWWLGADANHDAEMGPEPLTLRRAELHRRLQATARPIKSALLDQTLVAGLGNIYVDESLFAARIHPLRPSRELTTEETARLNRAIKQVLRKAIRFKGSTLRDYRDANGESGGFQIRHQVYARENKPCRVCGTPIRRIVLGGRSTCFCPACQKLPRRKNG